MHPPSLPPHLQSTPLPLNFQVLTREPLLVLALEEYFISPTEHTLAHLFTSLNEMDLTLLPTLTYLERTILIASDSKDMFREKFAAPISPLPPMSAGGRGEEEQSSPQSTHSREMSRDSLKRLTFINLTSGNRFQLSNQVGPKDCHFFETKIVYTGKKIPVQIPITATPDIVGDVLTLSYSPSQHHHFPSMPLSCKCDVVETSG